MARLVAFGKDAVHDLDSLDTVDLKAIRLARAWGANTNGHTPHSWTFSPCPREHCGRRRHPRLGNGRLYDLRPRGLRFAYPPAASLSTSCDTSRGSNGLLTKASAACFRGSLYPLIRMTGISARSGADLTISVNSVPFMPGRFTSQRITSGSSSGESC
jgi:hypothetical protein